MPFDDTCHAVDATVDDFHCPSIKDLVQLVVSENACLSGVGKILRRLLSHFY